MTKKEFINYVEEIRELYDKAALLTNTFLSLLNKEKLERIYIRENTPDFCNFEELLNEHLCYGTNNDFGFDTEDMWKVYQGINPYDLFYSKYEDDDL